MIVKFKYLVVVAIGLTLSGCKIQQPVNQNPRQVIPPAFNNLSDTTTIATMNWRQYFDDDNLIALIDTALLRNQELNMMMKEIEISRNEVRARKGEYLPFVGLQAGAGFDKAAEYTRTGAVDKSLEIKPGTPFPDPFSDYGIGLRASWEVDIWKKLRNGKKAAVARYLASVEGKNFMITNLVAELANSYYELLAYDNLLSIIQQNVAIQEDALQVVKHLKDAAKVSQLAINRFEAQLLNTKNLQYEIKQRIVETENRIHFLTGTFPAKISRSTVSFTDGSLNPVSVGVPSQLLANRPDIHQAELELEATHLEVKAARANFYPSLRVDAGTGFQAFNPAYLIKPQSLLYNLAGEVVAPLVNRNAIKAAYANANARQVQQLYNYQQVVLRAFTEVINQLSKVENYEQSFNTKSREVEILTQSIGISTNLFRSARADYLEVLLTQREALESKMELIEIRKEQLSAKVGIYKALGGGWR